MHSGMAVPRDRYPECHTEEEEGLGWGSMSKNYIKALLKPMKKQHDNRRLISVLRLWHELESMPSTSYRFQYNCSQKAHGVDPELL